MDNKIKVSAAILLLLISLSTCSASLSQFAGNWTNSDPNTGGLTKLAITVSGASASVHAWGSCHPTDCDWGTVPAYVFAPDVSSDPVSQAQALMASSIPASLRQLFLSNRREAACRCSLTPSSWTTVAGPIMPPAIHLTGR